MQQTQETNPKQLAMNKIRIREKKVMNKRQLTIIILLFLVTSSQVSAQTCHSETTIPSSTPSSRFRNNNNGTITDMATGLMWARCTEGQSGSACAGGDAMLFTWEGALKRASESTLAGYSDWRLPNIKELESIVEERCYNPAVNLAVFPGTPVSIFWSSTPVVHGIYWHDHSWYVDFANGNNNNTFARSSYYLARLVRSGL